MVLCLLAMVEGLGSTPNWDIAFFKVPKKKKIFRDPYVKITPEKTSMGQFIIFRKSRGKISMTL